MATDTRERILNKALEMFSTYGYKGTNLRDLASELGLSKSAIYRHFESKDAIFAALIEWLEEYYSEHFGSEENMPPVPTSLEELKSLTLKMIDFTIHDERIRRTRCFFESEQFHDERITRLASEHFLERQIHIFSALFEEMMFQGLLKENSASILALAYTAPITSMVHLCDREPKRETEAMVNITCFIDMFLETYSA